MDVLDIMLDELRHSRPPIYDADAYGIWESQIGQAIAAIGTQSLRFTAMRLVAEALAYATPGLSREMAFLRVAIAVIKETR
jgi:hypothetical protein